MLTFFRPELYITVGLLCNYHPRKPTIIIKFYKIPCLLRFFFSLPKIPFYRQKWIELCDINVELNDVNKVYVCSKHFQESDYTLRRDGFKQLRRGSIPFMKNCNGSDGSVNGDKIFCSENSLGEAESVKIDSVQHGNNFKNIKSQVYLLI